MKGRPGGRTSTELKYKVSIYTLINVDRTKYINSIKIAASQEQNRY